MRVVVTPFGTSRAEDAAYGRQFAHLLAESLKAIPNLEVLEVSFMARVHRQGREELVLVGFDTQFQEADWPQKVLSQLQADAVFFGSLRMEDPISLRLGLFTKLEETPKDELIELPRSDIAGFVESLLLTGARLLGQPPSPAVRAVSDSLRESVAEAVCALLLGWDALSYLHRAGDLVAEGMAFEPVFDALAKAVRLDPDYLAPYETLIQLTRLCLQLGCVAPEAVEIALSTVNKACEEDWRGWYSLADLYHRTDRPEEALPAFERALQLNPAEPALWTRLGITQSVLGHEAEAERSFQEAMARESPQEPSMAAPAYAALLIRQNRGDEAHALWQRLRDRDPTIEAHWLSLAQSHEMRGEPDEAIRVLETALDRVEHPEVVHLRLARMHMHRESHQRALAHYEAMLAAIQEQPAFAVEYADCLYFCNRVEDAIRVLEEALTTDPPNPVRAALLARKLEIEDPEKLERFRRLAESLSHRPNPTALLELEQLSRWLGDYWPIWEVLAKAQNAANRPEKAEEAARRLLTMQPQYPVAFAELVSSLLAQGREHEAFEALARALRRLPDEPTMLLNFGLVARKTGRDEDAERAARRLDRLGHTDLSSQIRELPQTDPRD